jgi:hypothetical protein
MKRYKSILTLVIVLSSYLLAQPTDILISEYVEGTSNNKALEFYNGTGSSIDLNAGIYVVLMYFNGSSSASTTIALTGTVANDDVYVLADDNANVIILAETDQTSTASFFNGDDAIELRKGGATGTILDVIGQVGFDPGTEWGTGLVSTADNTLRRKVGTIAGDTNPSDAFDPSVEWDGYATDTFDGLGSPDPLPVELSSFSAIVLENAIKLNWRTETEVSNYGFEIERASSSTTPLQGWEKIGFVEGHGNSNSPKDYSFVDENVSSGKYLYRLKQIDTDGQFEYSKIIEVDAGNIPDGFVLEQNYPNPFNPSTSIKFALAETQQAELKIFDILGNEVANLFNGIAEGEKVYEQEFNGKNLSSGIYFYRLETEIKVENRKMLLLK